jgi:hypothetical protein
VGRISDHLTQMKDTVAVYSRLMCWAARQAHCEYRAFARFACHSHVAALHARELARDGEAKPVPPSGERIGLGEILKQFCLLLRCHSDAAIRDGKSDPVVSVRHRPHPQRDLALFRERPLTTWEPRAPPDVSLSGALCPSLPPVVSVPETPPLGRTLGGVLLDGRWSGISMAERPVVLPFLLAYIKPQAVLLTMSSRWSLRNSHSRIACRRVAAFLVDYPLERLA